MEKHFHYQRTLTTFQMEHLGLSTQNIEFDVAVFSKVSLLFFTIPAIFLAVLAGHVGRLYDCIV